MHVPAVLDNAREAVAPALEKALSALSPETRQVVDYHMGWRDAQGQPVQRRGSKSVRPALALLSARAVGADPMVAVPGAVAVELLHNSTFLLDDVMDGDRFRRQRETAWVVFGQARAVCAGTALLMRSQRVVLDAPSAHRLAALEMLLDTVETMMSGQMLDLVFEDRLDISLAESMTMTESKTASLMRCAMSVGAVLAGGPGPAVAALQEYGTRVGLAFQARDDMLGVWGRPEQTGGRPPGFDVRARKGTLPIVAALNAGTDEAAELRTLLSAADLTDEAVARAVTLVEAAGGRAYTADLARTMVGRAVAALDALDAADAETRDGLVQVARMGLPDDV